jgi:hypothetical protein
MTFTALQSVVGIDVPDVSGSSDPTIASAFPLGPMWSSVATGPRHRLKRRVHPRVSFGSPPEFVVSTSAPICLRASERLPWGFHPHRGVSPASPLNSEHPGSPSFRPQRFARSRRLTPRCTLQICFTLLPRPGFSLRGSSPDPAAPPRRWPCPLAVGAASLSPVARRRQARVASTSGPRSGPGSAALPRGLAQVRRPCPVAFSPSDSRCRPCPRSERRLHP